MDSLIWVGKVIWDAGNDWVDDKATKMSAALAFYMILSLAPLLILVVAIAGAVFGKEAAQGELTTQLTEFVGESGADVVQSMLAHAHEPSQGITASIFSIALLLFGASGVFAELQDSLNTIWDVRGKSGRGIRNYIRTRILSFGMVLGVGFLLLVSLLLSTIMSITSSRIGLSGTSILTMVAHSVLTFVIITLLFAMIFKLLPEVKISWRDVWLGAALTGLMFSLGKYGIGYYLSHAGTKSTFGAAGSLVVFAVWIYYSSLILFLGAEITQVYAWRLRRLEPTEHAEIIPKPSAAAVAEVEDTNKHKARH